MAGGCLSVLHLDAVPGVGSQCIGGREERVGTACAVPEVDGGRDASATERHALWAGRGVVGDSHTGAATAVGRGREGDADGAGGIDRQCIGADRTGISLGEVSRVGAAQADAADTQRRVPLLVSIAL